MELVSCTVCVDEEFEFSPFKLAKQHIIKKMIYMSALA